MKPNFDHLFSLVGKYIEDREYAEQLSKLGKQDGQSQPEFLRSLLDAHMETKATYEKLVGFYREVSGAKKTQQ